MDREQAIKIILVFYKDKDVKWAERQLTKAWENSDHASYGDILREIFGISVRTKIPASFRGDEYCDLHQDNKSRCSCE